MKTKKNKKKTNKKNSNYKQFRKIPAAVLDEEFKNFLLSIMSIKTNAHGQLFWEQRKSKIKCANEMESKIVDWVSKIVRRSLANPEAVQHVLEQNLNSIETSVLQLNGTLPHLNSIASVMAIVMLMAYSALKLDYISAETFHSVAAFITVMGDGTYKNGATPPADAD